MDFLYFFGLLNLKDRNLNIDDDRIEKMFGWSPPQGTSKSSHQRHRIRLLKYAQKTDAKTLERLCSNRRLFALSYDNEVKCTVNSRDLPVPTEQDVMFRIRMVNVESAFLELQDMDSSTDVRVPFERVSMPASARRDCYLDTYLPLCLMKRIGISVSYVPTGTRAPVLTYSGIIFEDRPETISSTRESSDIDVLLHAPDEYASIDISSDGDEVQKISSKVPLDFEVNGARYRIQDHHVTKIRPMSILG